MGRRVSIVGVALLLAGLLSCRGGAVAADDPPAPPTTPELPTPAASRVAPLELPPIPDEDISAADLHRRAVVVDLHADTLWQLWKKTTPGEAPELPLQASPDRLRAGGVDAQLYPIFVWPQSASPRDVMFQTLEVWRRDLLAGYPDVEIARSAEDVLRLAGEGRPAALLAIEGAKGLVANPEEVEEFIDAGLTYLSLTWNESNGFADGVKEQQHGGATAAGLALVSRLDEARVLPDISHASVDTFWDVLTTATRPVIASHSNARAVTDHPRNLDDTQLWAIADVGGVVGINFHARFLSEGDAGADLSDLSAHVAHLRAVMGPGHVALGSDFDGRIVEPEGLPDASTASLAVTEALLADGLRPGEVAGILGHDFLGVLHETKRGTARTPLRHRPASILEVTGTGGDERLGWLRDRYTTTAWAAPVNKDAIGASVTLRVAGPGVDRISLAADGPDQPSSVTRVRISVRAPAEQFDYTVEVGLGEGPRP
ncbi:MAG: dipeptidase, partial [Myxococcota bacterium]|nr:dipeptidase [Myxococcota bacterium]